MRRDTIAWLDVPAEEAARRLLGCDLISKVDGRLVRVRIVETEAYDQVDEASHAFKGRTNRNDAMFKSAGTCMSISPMVCIIAAMSLLAKKVRDRLF